MLTIAICEDDASCQKHLIQILHSISSKEDYSIHTFSSGEDFLNDFSYGRFDLIFMDIYMQKISGVDTIARLRQIDKYVPVAFTTTSQDYALEAYRLNVVKYLEKPVKKTDVIECIKLAQLNKTNKKWITLTISGKINSFCENNILYLEQRNHTIFLYLDNDNTITFSGKLDDILQEFSDSCFYRCHKSYLVNLSNVVNIDHTLNVFIMKNGDKAYIKREKTKEAGILLDRFLFEQLRKDF